MAMKSSKSVSPRHTERLHEIFFGAPSNVTVYNCSLSFCGKKDKEEDEEEEGENENGRREGGR